MTEWLLLLLDSFRGVWRFIRVAWGWNSCEWHPYVVLCVAMLLPTSSLSLFVFPPHSPSKPLSFSLCLSFCISLPTALYIITGSTTRVCEICIIELPLVQRAGSKSCNAIIKKSITLTLDLVDREDSLREYRHRPRFPLCPLIGFQAVSAGYFVDVISRDRVASRAQYFGDRRD